MLGGTRGGLESWDGRRWQCSSKRFPNFKLYSTALHIHMCDNARTGAYYSIDDYINLCLFGSTGSTFYVFRL